MSPLIPHITYHVLSTCPTAGTSVALVLVMTTTNKLAPGDTVEIVGTDYRGKVMWYEKQNGYIKVQDLKTRRVDEMLASQLTLVPRTAK